MKSARWFVKITAVMLAWPVLASLDAMRLHKHVENVKFVKSMSQDDEAQMMVTSYDQTQDLTYRAMKWAHK